LGDLVHLDDAEAHILPHFMEGPLGLGVRSKRAEDMQA